MVEGQSIVEKVLSGRIDRREFMRQAAILGLSAPVASAILSACGTSNAASSTKTVTYGVPALAEGLDREFFISGPALEAEGNAFEPITMWKRRAFGDGSFVPVFDTDNWDLNLLADLGHSADGKTWTFKFKPGTMSHAGNELTAQDYFYCLARHEELWTLGSFYNFVARIPRRTGAYKVVDKYTITVSTETPSPTYLRLLENNWAMGLFDGTEMKKHATTDDPWSRTWAKTQGDKAGHGPYTIDVYDPSSQIVYKAFDKYHRGKPKVDKVIQKLIPSSATRSALLKAGSIDIARDLLPTELEDLASSSGVAIDNFNTIRSQILFLMFRNDVAPFNNVKVRQALAYAAPYQEIVQDVYRGKYATQWKGIISRDYPYFTDANWPYGGGDDVAKGKSLLAEAGHPNGFSSTMLYNADQPDSEQVAIKLQTAFDKIGVHFELQKLASAAFTDRYTGKKFDTLLVKELALTPDIGYATYLWYQSKAFVNVMNYNSPQVDQLSETILSNLDENVRKTAGEQLQNIVVQDSPALFLAQPHFVVARRSNIKGVTGYTSRDLRFDDLDKT